MAEKHGHTLQTVVRLASLRTSQTTTAADLTAEGTLKKRQNRTSRLLAHTLKDLYWTQINWMKVKVTTTSWIYCTLRKQTIKRYKVIVHLCVPLYCSDVNYIYVSVLGLRGSCPSFQLGNPTWVAVWLHFSGWKVVFPMFWVQWNAPWSCQIHAVDLREV